MTRELLEELYIKWCAGNMSAMEWEQFQAAATDAASHHWLEEIIGNALLAPEFDQILSPGESISAYEKLREKIMTTELVPVPALVRPVTRWLRSWWMAASVLLVVATTVLLWKYGSRRNTTEVISRHAEIAPGKEGAILTLVDGSQVLLDTIKNGIVALQAGATAKLVNGTLVYENNDEQGFVYNTITAPRGRQFRFTLADGTRVWLNAASSISYPTRFTGNRREVAMQGEAYFEVVDKPSMPFHVNVNDRAEVQVLGTQFNINAYENEAAIAATLLQGKIKVVAGKAGRRPSLVLAPGQQARLNHITPGNSVTPEIALVPDADLEKVMAWRNGIFNFNGASLDEVMKQLERWYDIEVVYEQGIPRKKLIGKMTKDVTLNGLLIGLKELGIHYRLEERKLIVLP